MKFVQKLTSNLRLWVQIIFTALTNGYVLGFAKGKIYQGGSKQLCVPGLNCYSCPGAVGACPIDSLMGRFVCGWLCPFGLIQDLLHKIPVKKIRKVPGDKYLRYSKYVVLVVFVIGMPLLLTGKSGYSSPWFCKLICPSGMLMGGIPLVSANPNLQRIIGVLFGWKMSILVLVVVASILIYRPFCKYLCPLGAIYGLFNRFLLYRYEIDNSKCTKCGLCHKKCEMGVKVYEPPNSAECIRCGKCMKVCPHQAIHTTLPISRI